MDGLDDILGLLAVIVFYVLPWFLKRFRRGEDESAEAEPEPSVQPVPVPVDHPQRPSPQARQAVTGLTEDERQWLANVQQRANDLAARVRIDPRTARLVEVVETELVPRLRHVSQALQAASSAGELATAQNELSRLTRALAYVEAMADQRQQQGGHQHGMHRATDLEFLGDADRMADACYEPLLSFAEAHGIGLKSATPIALHGDWGLSTVVDLATFRLAPLRLPDSFADSLWKWPAIAHEIAHDFYYSISGLERSLHQRLKLPLRSFVPTNARDARTYSARDYYGAWLSELVADMLGTLMMGPAYVHTMIEAFATPHRHAEAGVIRADNGIVDIHPPRHIRVYLATYVLNFLGQYEIASDLWQAWKARHGDLDVIFVPVENLYARVPEQVFLAHGEDIFHTLLNDSWPELAGTTLLDVPGLSYLHAEHAKVERLMPQLHDGKVVRADPRLVVAAAVLQMIAANDQHDVIFEAAHRSIIGVGTSEAIFRARDVQLPGNIPLSDRLRAELRNPSAITEAIALGAAFSPRRSKPYRA